MSKGPPPSARLLLVDDEPALVHLMQRYLTGLGYVVDACQSGREACELFSAKGPDAYALVLADMNMPDMSGDVLLDRLLEINPATRVLVCSGYPFDISKLAEKNPNQFAFLQKPFLPRMLEEVIRRMLAGAPASAD